MGLNKVFNQMGLDETLSNLCKLTIYSAPGESPNAAVRAKYNPKELSFQKDVGWAKNEEGIATDYPAFQWTKGNPISVTANLYFDKYEENGDVRREIAALMSLCLKAKQKEGDERPPKVKILWGGDIMAGTSFDEAVIKSVQVTYTMFMPSGAPCRATAQVTLEQAADVKGASSSDGGADNEFASPNSMTREQQQAALDQDVDVTNLNNYPLHLG